MGVWNSKRARRRRAARARYNPHQARSLLAGIKRWLGPSLDQELFIPAPPSFERVVAETHAALVRAIGLPEHLLDNESLFTLAQTIAARALFRAKIRRARQLLVPWIVARPAREV